MSRNCSLRRERVAGQSAKRPRRSPWPVGEVGPVDDRPPRPRGSCPRPSRRKQQIRRTPAPRGQVVHDRARRRTRGRRRPSARAWSTTPGHRQTPCSAGDCGSRHLHRRRRSRTVPPRQAARRSDPQVGADDHLGGITGNRRNTESPDPCDNRRRTVPHERPVEAHNRDRHRRRRPPVPELRVDGARVDHPGDAGQLRHIAPAPAASRPTRPRARPHRRAGGPRRRRCANRTDRSSPATSA